MRDAPHTKPLPARPPEGAARAGFTKPTPARELGGTDGRDATASETAPRPSTGAEPDIDETGVELDGATWTVRVLGRSGRAGDRSPPLLLLGFWPERGAGEHTREATIVARTLAELSPTRLQEALARSIPPPQSERRKPFFDAASQGRRGGSARRDG